MKEFLFLLLVVTALSGCNQEHKKAAAPQVHDPMAVSPSPALLGQLRISAVNTQPVAETLRVSGRIDFDEQRLARIGATVTGRVTDIDALLGQSVKKERFWPA
ncbi:hypothetical protein [Dechloromonas sp. HYN0024]|uniref:hypothetical protein n=1 Tax=Dechloromonas sp. HYN0024 TaxID=2231055 RepID=UPI00267E856F